MLLAGVIYYFGAGYAKPLEVPIAIQPAVVNYLARLGWAHGALLTTFPGDTTMATLEQVRALAKGSSARIQR